MFEYNAKTLKVVDGDTVDAMVDLGFDTWKKVRIRLKGINAPESRTRDLEEKKRGLAAKMFLSNLLERNDSKFILKSHGVGKFGRCLGEIILENPDILKMYPGSVHPFHGYKTLPTANQIMINEGHAVEYHGGKRK
jgi:micrococcal nuclease